MNLTLFGATGKTGRHLLEQALAQGRTVTVLARSPAKLAQRHDRLIVIQGDIREAAKVAQAALAAFVLNQLEAKTYVGRAPAISN